MYTPSLFADSVGSFRYPVIPPSSKPFDAPLFQMCVNADWLPFIAGALKQLLLQATWRDLDDASLQDIQGRVFDLIAAFGQVEAGCGAVIPDLLCLAGSFSDQMYGYESVPSALCPSVWLSGTGWTSCDDGAGNQILSIRRDFTSSTLIKSYEFDWSTGIFAGNIAVTINWFSAGSVIRTDNYTLLPTGRTAINSTPVSADAVEILSSFVQTIPADSMVLAGWKLCYSGVFPLSDREQPINVSYLFGSGPSVVHRGVPFDVVTSVHTNPPHADAQVIYPQWSRCLTASVVDVGVYTRYPVTNSSGQTDDCGGGNTNLDDHTFVGGDSYLGLTGLNINSLTSCTIRLVLS